MMKTQIFLSTVIAWLAAPLLLLVVSTLAAEAPNFAGEYADKKFLNGPGCVSNESRAKREHRVGVVQCRL